MSSTGPSLPLVILAALVVFLVCDVSGKPYDRVNTYSNDVVVNCYGANDRRVKLMMDNDNVDVWQVHSSGKVEMQMNKRLYASIENYVADVCHVNIQNVEAHVQNAMEQMLSDRQLYDGQIANSQALITDANLFKEYHNLNAIAEWYEQLAKDHPRLVTFVKSIGKSVEGRDIFAVHITSNDETNAQLASSKPKFYMQCLIHAREWISGSACMYNARSLVQGYDTDDKITKLVKSMEFVIVPVVNPDGYVHTWLLDRLWRKNRARVSSGCYGVDLNRNFGEGWGNSASACSQTYSGPSAESEPETQAIVQYYKKNAPFLVAVDFHSYGQLVLRPYGYKDLAVKQEDLMAEIGKEVIQQMKMANGQDYKSEVSKDLYESHGIASDWFYTKRANGNSVNALSYTIELRDDGTAGFLLPKSQIEATCQEANKAFLYLAERSLKEQTRSIKEQPQ